jgi:hypothetical protein
MRLYSGQRNGAGKRRLRETRGRSISMVGIGERQR